MPFQRANYTRGESALRTPSCSHALAYICMVAISSATGSRSLVELPATVSDMHVTDMTSTVVGDKVDDFVAVTAADTANVLRRGRLEDLRTRHGWKRLLTEGHTVFDAVLTVAMAQIVRQTPPSHDQPTIPCPALAMHPPRV